MKNKAEWSRYCKSGIKPDNIPAYPDGVYQDAGWKGYGDWLGTGTIANQDRKWMPFEDARLFVRKLGLKSHREWRDYCKSDQKPSNIPAYPNEVYNDKGWNGVGDWLGTSRMANQKQHQK